MWLLFGFRLLLSGFTLASVGFRSVRAGHACGFRVASFVVSGLLLIPDGRAFEIALACY